MSDAVHEAFRRRALDLIDERRIDPGADPLRLREAAEAAVDEHLRRVQLGEAPPLADPAGTVDRLVRSLAHLGGLGGLLARPDIEEVFVEGSRVSFLDRSGRLAVLDEPTTADENRHAVDRLLASADRRLDASSPIVQARVLDGGARLTAVAPPVSDRLSVTIRRHADRSSTLDDLVRLGSIGEELRRFLGRVAASRASVLVSGPPGAGKTTLLAALVAAAPPTHCIRICEEVRELRMPLAHGSSYEARPAGLDGAGEIGLRALVKVVLAMRPDRIVVGEVRGEEAYELTRAVNAGTGFACTIHADSAGSALDALVHAAAMAGSRVGPEVLRSVFAGSLDLVVHVDRDGGADGPIRRRVVEVLAVDADRHGFVTTPLFRAGSGRVAVPTGKSEPARLARRLGSAQA